MTHRQSSAKKKYHSSNHTYPKCMLQFIESFELMQRNGKKLVDKVYPGEYRAASDNEAGLKIKGYDESKSAYKIEITYEGFIQVFNLKVLPENRKHFERYLNYCLM